MERRDALRFATFRFASGIIAKLWSLALIFMLLRVPCLPDGAPSVPPLSHSVSMHSPYSVAPRRSLRGNYLGGL